MNGRRDDEARPTNARPTKRDVPLARVSEQAAGTSPPAALRGRQLEPGQGAPERYDPSQVELAALREAETLDPPELIQRSGANLERAQIISEPVPSPSPTPVSVEVPRVRSVPPVESYASVGSSGKTRSVQSGTLLSVGGVDPRAPTERRLEAPRMFLSQSEHEAHAYFKAKTVPPMVRPREQPLATIQIAEPSAPDVSAPVSAPQPRVPDESTSQSGRRPRSDVPEVDSSVPPAQRFDRPAASEPKRAPLSVEPARPTPSTEPAPISDGSRPHADLSSFQHEESGDPDFDLRGVPTDPEPLARRARAASDPDLRQRSWPPAEREARREVSTLPAPPELTPPETYRASLPGISRAATVDARRRWLPVLVAAAMLASAAWLGLSARSPEPASAPQPASAPAAMLPAVTSSVPLAQPQPAALVVLPPPAVSSSTAAAVPVASPSASSSAPSLASARPADSVARPASSASGAPALPGSGLDTPRAPAAQAVSAAPRRSIY